jgi:hypothetical protein
MYAIRLKGNSWYIEHGKDAIGSSRDLDEARRYKTEKDAETAAILLTLSHAQWMRKVKVVKVREVTKSRVVCLNPDEKRSNYRRYEMANRPHWVTC